MAGRRREDDRVRIGRPSKPVEERQRNRVALAFTDSEMRALIAAADGQPVATWIRETILRSLARRRR